MEHCRHEGKSRNADYILIAEGDTFPSEPSEPFEPSEPSRLQVCHFSLFYTPHPWYNNTNPLEKVV